ncbi:hypothetical protein MKQ68_17920 [Chitinophaga horti]|uniref:DUF3052 family protein n=1 Tax=Chitinophaga horti TaxID=2920382 RepID=A0ABY6IXN8_9BACT|nr:hypothetical protein [Chitinophaga horti]UYQ91966.1 hypothetical protein MKQ68_17920 [Chitinophaga horti]
MKTKTIAEKMRLSASAKGVVINFTPETLPDMQLPSHFYQDKLSGKFDYIHFFVIDKQQLEKQFKTLISHLNEKGTLWVSWPKGRKLGTDLDIKEVIRIGYNFKMVESVCMRIDDVWSALKFTFPKPGKEYHNSYGKHP